MFRSICQLPNRSLRRPTLQGSCRSPPKRERTDPLRISRRAGQLSADRPLHPPFGRRASEIPGAPRRLPGRYPGDLVALDAGTNLEILHVVPAALRDLRAVVSSARRGAWVSHDGSNLAPWSPRLPRPFHPLRTGAEIGIVVDRRHANERVRRRRWMRGRA